MAVIAIDGFGQYANAAEVLSLPGTRWSGNVSPSGNQNPYSLTRASGISSSDELKVVGGGPNSALFRDMMGTFTTVAFSFDFKAVASTNRLFIGLVPQAWITADRYSSNSGGGLIAIGFEVNGLNASLYHELPTAATAAAAKNSLQLGSTSALTADANYHVDVFCKLNGPTSQAILYLNGQKVVDVTFNSDRIDNNYQAKSFSHLCLATGRTGNSSINVANPISNLFIYEPDAELVFPVGSVDIKSYSPSATLGTPADDSTFVNINTDTYQNYAIPSGSVPSGAVVVGAVAHVRLKGSGGTDTANSDVVLDINGERLVMAQTPIAPGLATRLFTKILTKQQSTVTNINSAIYKMRSPL